MDTNKHELEKIEIREELAHKLEVLEMRQELCNKDRQLLEMVQQNINMAKQALFKEIYDIHEVERSEYEIAVEKGKVFLRSRNGRN